MYMLIGWWCLTTGGAKVAVYKVDPRAGLFYAAFHLHISYLAQSDESSMHRNCYHNQKQTHTQTSIAQEKVSGFSP